MALSLSDSINTAAFSLFSRTFSHLEVFLPDLVSVSLAVPYHFTQKILVLTLQIRDQFLLNFDPELAV
jgi:hypothetical protein